jgi:arginyl-tRNA synthetase
MNIIHHHIATYLAHEGFGDVSVMEFTSPPDKDMGDIALPCFSLAKASGKTPSEIAAGIAESINKKKPPFIHSASSDGPYVNMILDGKTLAQIVLLSVTPTYGKWDGGSSEKVIIEYGCPNPFKLFHIGHLKNLITGESICRIYENAGFSVMRVNYQGDVGMQVAKAMWGIFADIETFNAVATKPLKERMAFFGQAYVNGAQAFENDESKQEVIDYNKKIYHKDPDVLDVYEQGRSWSLAYFDEIYARLGVRFDQLYFESDVLDAAIDLVKKGETKGIFVKSEGAIIYEGEKEGLHNRVFVNSEGFPTYEAKDLGLAARHFAQKPTKVIHVVGREQTDYFNVVFAAIEKMFPAFSGVQMHVPGGFLQLKGDMKMSSRKGNVVTGDVLIDMIAEQVAAYTQDDEGLSEETKENIMLAALKYSLLRANVTKDIAFNIEESVSTSGDSGPYILYNVTRLGSILKKAAQSSDAAVQGARDILETYNSEDVTPAEKHLLLALAQYPSVTMQALSTNDPSHIAQYLFSVAQLCNSFYDTCPVLQAAPPQQSFRLGLIAVTKQVIEHGLSLLAIETVDVM